MLASSVRASSAIRSCFAACIWLLTCCRLASGATLSEHAGDSFDAYVKAYGRQYKKGSSEYAKRRALFEHRSNAVDAHNMKPQRRWQAVAGIFADRTEAERAAARGWRRMGDSLTQGGVMRPGTAVGASLLALEAEKPKARPVSLDYRFLKTASKIVDQQACGSCWAVTTAAVLEAHYELHHGVPRAFSVQEILSCTKNPKQCGGKGGCDGATVELGMQWVLENSVGSEDSFPYEAQDKECPMGSENEEMLNRHGHHHHHGLEKGRQLGMVGWQTVTPKNKVEPLMKAVADWGPTAISVSGDRWMEYSGGIFDGCDKDVIVDHAVTLYGYGKEEEHKYWLIRNTWGPDWGEGGYIRLLRHDAHESYCGTDTDNQQGVGCKGDPKTVEVCGMCGMLTDSVVPHFHGARNLTHADAAHWLLGDQPGLVATIESLGAATGVASAATALGDGVSRTLNERQSSSHEGSDATPRIVRREEHGRSMT